MLYPPHAAVSQAAVQSLLYIIILRVFKGVANTSECFALPFICHLCENKSRSC